MGQKHDRVLQPRKEIRLSQHVSVRNDDQVADILYYVANYNRTDYKIL